MLPLGKLTQLHATVKNLTHYTTIECDLAPMSTPSDTTITVNKHSSLAKLASKQPAHKTVTTRS